MSVANSGLQTLQNLVVELSQPDSLLNLAERFVTIPSLQPGQSVTLPAAFSFSLKNALDDGSPVKITLGASAAGRNWTKSTWLKVSAPTLSMGQPHLEDGFNNLLEPGEVADLVVEVKNTGSLPAYNAEIQLFSSDTALAVLSQPTLLLDSIPPLSVPGFSFRLKASRSISPGTKIPVQFRMTDTRGVVSNLDFLLQVGKKQVALADLSQKKYSLAAMKTALDSLHVSYDTVAALPFNYEDYSCIFLNLGTEGTGYHTLNYAEASSLVPYLRHHGNLYLESYLTWYYVNNTPLHPWFKYTTGKISSYSYLEIGGVQGTLSDSLAFYYNSPLNHALFSFDPVSPAFATLIDTAVPGRNFEIAHDGSDYRTIGTFLGFAAMVGNGYPSTQENLMKRYLGFFGLNLTGPYPFFHASSVSVCTGKTLEFTDDSFDNVISRSWEFPGGVPATSTAASPVVRYDSAGRFDVKLTVSDGSHTKSILKSGYINAGHCTGIAAPEQGLSFGVYPNPVHGRLNVCIGRTNTGPMCLSLYDLNGRKRLERNFRAVSAGLTFDLDLSGIPGGVYLLVVLSGDHPVTRKVIVY
jgi:hypothetical protein